MNWEIFWSVFTAGIAIVVIVGLTFRNSHAAIFNEADQRLRCALADYSDFLPHHNRIARKMHKLELASIDAAGDDDDRYTVCQLQLQNLTIGRYLQRQQFTREEKLDRLIERAESLAEEYRVKLDKLRENNDE